jgi:hypothetical protein
MAYRYAQLAGGLDRLKRASFGRHGGINRRAWRYRAE